MPDIQQRIAGRLREDLSAWLTGFCEGAEVDIHGDSLLTTADELADALAEVLVSELGLTRETGQYGWADGDVLGDAYRYVTEWVPE